MRSRSSIEANSTVILPLPPPVFTPTRGSKASDSLFASSVTGRAGEQLGRHHGDDALEVVDRGELDGDLALTPADVHADTGVEGVGQLVRELGDGRRGEPLARRRARRLGLVPAVLEQRDELLG